MGLFDMFGGGGDEEVSLPTLGESVEDWRAQLPNVMAAQKQYAPQQAELQYDMFNQYAPQYAQTQADISKSIYPETYGLQEQMAAQASEGLSGDLTDSERRQFLDLQKSLVGDQATSGIGTDYIGSNLLNYVQGRQTNNQNLGLQLLNKIPQQQLMQPSYTDYMSGFTPNTATSFNLGSYALLPQQGDTTSGMGGLLGGLDLGGIIDGIGGMFNQGGNQPYNSSTFGSTQDISTSSGSGFRNYGSIGGGSSFS